MPYQITLTAICICREGVCVEVINALPGTVGANFELLLRDDNDPNSNPNSRTVVLITNGVILVSM
jgi:hypothetical protein